MEIIYKRAIIDEELYQILELQHKNSSTSISETEKQKEGFITVLHSFKLLKAMNNKYVHSIAKAYRKKGVFRDLYNKMKALLNAEYHAIITEVDTANTQSLNAHLAIGFKTLYSYRFLRIKIGIF